MQSMRVSSKAQPLQLTDLYANQRSLRGAVVIQLYGTSGHEAPMATWCAKSCPLRREECPQIGDRWSPGFEGEGVGIECREDREGCLPASGYI